MNITVFLSTVQTTLLTSCLLLFYPYTYNKYRKCVHLFVVAYVRMSIHMYGTYMTQKTFQSNSVVVLRKHPQIVVQSDADLPRGQTRIFRVDSG